MPIIEVFFNIETVIKQRKQGETRIIDERRFHFIDKNKWTSIFELCYFTVLNFACLERKCYL